MIEGEREKQMIHNTPQNTPQIISHYHVSGACSEVGTHKEIPCTSNVETYDWPSNIVQRGNRFYLKALIDGKHYLIPVLPQ